MAFRHLRMVRHNLSAVVFVGYAGQSDGNTVLRRHGSEWKCNHRKSAGMGGTRKTYQGNDTASEFQDDADFFGERYGMAALKITGFSDRIHILVPYTASAYNGLSRLF